MRKCLITILNGDATLEKGKSQSLKDCCAVLDPKRDANLAFKDGRWDGYVKLYEGRDFPAGFVSKVKKWHKKRGYKVTIRDTTLWEQPDPDQVNKKMLYNATIRGEQLESIRKLVSKRIGRISVPTGGGKTLMLAADAKVQIAEGRRVLLISPGIGLNAQNADEMQRFLGTDVRVGIVGGGKKQVDAEVVCVCGNSLQGAFAKYRKVRRGRRMVHERKPADPAIKKLLTFEAILVDEAHVAAADTWYKFVKQSNAVVRHGVSGTVEDIRNPIRNLRYRAVCGPVIHRRTYEQLRELDLLKRVRIVSVEIGSPGSLSHLRGSSGYAEAYRLAYCGEAHIDRVCKDVKWLVSQGRKPLVVTRILDQYKALRKAFKRAGIRFRGMSGKTPVESRKQMKRDMMNGDADVLLANKVFNQGENCPIIDAVVLAEAVSSHTEAIQRVGRGTRRMKDRPKDVWVLDYDPVSHDRLSVHAGQRVESWNREGYEVKKAKSVRAFARA